MTIQQVADWLTEASSAVAFTGAGISTESGIPDFRSPGGVWANSTPVYFNDFLESAEARYEYWRQKSVSHDGFMTAEPNAGHLTLARWESSGRIEGTITQNIDGLHQLAGSHNVLELHGTAREIMCLECEQRYDADEMVQKFLADDAPPPCPACNGITKHATVSFGQALPFDVMRSASRLAKQADLFFAIGSSLVVEPAASLPRHAASGGRLVIINRDPTPLDDYAAVIFRESIGEVLTAIDAALL